jgi:hypothetical protein
MPLQNPIQASTEPSSLREKANNDSCGFEDPKPVPFQIPKTEQTAKSKTEIAVCKETEKAITVSIGEKPFFVYNKSIVEPPAGIASVFRRSGYIHPIRTPNGIEVTGDFAPDHAHQHAFFMAWVNTKFKNNEVDFWNQKKKTGRISHSNVLSIKNTNKYSEFQVQLSHEDITTPDRPVQVLSETWKVRAYPHSTGQPFVFDFESNQTCVADSPLVLNKHVYGGFGLRGNQKWLRPESERTFRKWQKQNTASKKRANKDTNLPLIPPPGIDVLGHNFLTSKNNQRHDGNHTRVRWATIYGVADSKIAGIAVLSHPTNFRAPQFVRLHPSKPYFSFSPIVQEPFQIKPKENYSTRFRVVSYDGKPDAGSLNRLWDEFAKLKPDQ